MIRFCENFQLEELASANPLPILLSETDLEPIMKNAGSSIPKREYNPEAICYVVDRNPKAPSRIKKSVLQQASCKVKRKNIKTKATFYKKYKKPYKARQYHHMSDTWDFRSAMIQSVRSSKNKHSTHLTKITISNQQEFDHFCIYLEYTHRYYNHLRLSRTFDVASNGFVDLLK